MSKQQLMNAMDTKRMLAMLYSDLKVEESGTPAENDANAIYGTYIDDDDVPVSLAVIDRGFAAHLGAALTLIPPGTASDAAATGDFSKEIMDNVREVLNILSRILMDGTSPHLRFAEVRMTRGDLTGPEQAVMDGIAARLDMRMEVPGYGGGLCSLVTL